MSVFRGSYTKNGKSLRTSRFYIEFKDQRGIRRRVPGHKSLKESQALAEIIDRLVACKQNSALPDAHLLRAIETMPAKVRERLMDFDVLDKQRRHAAKAIADHLDDYRDELEARGAGAGWARSVRTRALRLFDAAGCKSLSDITEGRVIVAADNLRKAKGLSYQTHNHGLAACKAFTRWAAPERMNTDPLSKLPISMSDARANRVHARRALTAEEARALLSATEAGPVTWNMPGHERALIYRLALETGLRANEIRSLTRSAFVLDGTQPTVTVEARHTKNKKPATLPLRPALVGLLRGHLAHKLPGALAFNIPASTHTAEMLKADLQAAEVEYEVDGKFADFHALRHTFITNLARAGVMPNVARELARHSTITLTMDYYTHTRLGDNAAAVAKLPDLDVGPAAETA